MHSGHLDKLSSTGCLLWGSWGCSLVIGMQSSHRDTVSKPRAFQGGHQTAKTTEQWVTGGSFAVSANMVETKRTIEVAMVATNRYMGRLVQITVGNKASGEGCREPSKTTSWPQSLFQKTPSAQFHTR